MSSSPAYRTAPPLAPGHHARAVLRPGCNYYHSLRLLLNGSLKSFLCFFNEGNVRPEFVSRSAGRSVLPADSNDDLHIEYVACLSSPFICVVCLQFLAGGRDSSQITSARSPAVRIRFEKSLSSPFLSKGVDFSGETRTCVCNAFP